MNEARQVSIQISCMIPTLGRGRILCDTVEMLLAQSYPAHEIIVVDQTVAPDAATRETLTEWNQQGKIRWLRQTEPNASKARNVGTLAATGDVILFLDDDILIKPDFLAAYAETFERTNAVGVSGQILEGDAKPVDKLPPEALDPEIGWLYFPKTYSKECETSFMMSGNVAIRREFFLAVGGMDENYERGAYREESDFAMRFKRAGYRFRYNPQCNIYHLGMHIVPDGGSRSASHKSTYWFLHHCVGDWYFILGFATRRNLGIYLAKGTLRSYILNRHTLHRPLFILGGIIAWIAAFWIALGRRLRGRKLIASRK